MIIDLYKDNLIYRMDFFNPFTRKDEIQDLLDQGYERVFDTRELTNIQGKSGTLILENDITVPTRLLCLKDDIQRHGFKSSKDLIITSLHPMHFETLQNEINGDLRDSPKKIKNILIDSLFDNRNQIKYGILKCFSNFLDLNYFVISHGRLLDVLNDELTNYMDEYPVRNSAFKNFNELTFTLIKNKFYDVEMTYIDDKFQPDYVREIIYDCATQSVTYGSRYKWNYNNNIPLYKAEQITKPDIWNI